MMKRLRVVHAVAFVGLCFISSQLLEGGLGMAQAADSTRLAPKALMTVEGEKLPAYELPNSAVHELPSNQLGRQYQVWVDLPASYASSDRKYPIVFVTDANYAFPLVRSIRNRLGAKGQNIEDFILVGLSYAQGDTPTVSCSRDYTPTNPLLDPQRDKKNYAAAIYGEAAAYRDYLEQQVFPFIAQHYRADMQRKVYAGHSYGGLFGAYVLLTKPSMFQSYILGSPTLWFDRDRILQYERQYAENHKDLSARVMIYAGAYEAIQPGPRFNTTQDMVKTC